MGGLYYKIGQIQVDTRRRSAALASYRAGVGLTSRLRNSSQISYSLVYKGYYRIAMLRLNDEDTRGALASVRKALQTAEDWAVAEQSIDARSAVVSAHNVVKPDLWTPRLVTLGPDDKAQPVRIGIWDSGVDVTDFGDRVFTDESGHHGFAFTLHDDPSPDLLFPLGDAQAHADELIGRIKGFSDLQAGIDSHCVHYV